jgi:hypothetical protein
MEVGSSHVGEVWQSPDMMGYHESLGGDAHKGFQFVDSAWERHSWLAHFFVRRDDFQMAIRAYNLFAGVIELTRFVSRGAAASTPGLPRHVSVPPVFLTPKSGNWDVPSVGRLLSVAVPDKTVLRKIADEYDCGVNQLRAAWPEFYRDWVGRLPRLHRSVMVGGQHQPPELP